MVAYPAFAADIAGVVTEVRDGNSLIIGGTRIHLFGIDAPALEQLCRADAICEPGPSPCFPCGAWARDKLAGLVLNKDVHCIDRGKFEDGISGDCTAGKILVGPWMLTNGHAVLDRQALQPKDRATYIGAEASGKRAAMGMWSMTFIPPSDWRNKKLRLACER